MNVAAGRRVVAVRSVFDEASGRRSAGHAARERIAIHQRALFVAIPVAVRVTIPKSARSTGSAGRAGALADLAGAGARTAESAARIIAAYIGYAKA